MAECNPTKNPIEKGLLNQLYREGYCTTQPYRELLGSLFCVRPDLCFAIQSAIPEQFPEIPKGKSLAGTEAGLLDTLKGPLPWDYILS